MQTAYYISQFTDEVMPCGTELNDWAEWLSKPDEEWRRDEPAKDGEAFKASVYEFHQVSVVKENGDWTLKPAAPENTEFMALRYGNGMGWDAEDIASDMGELSEILDGTISVHPEAAYFVACAVPKPDVTLIFRTGEKPVLEVAANN